MFSLTPTSIGGFTIGRNIPTPRQRENTAARINIYTPSTIRMHSVLHWRDRTSEQTTSNKHCSH